MTAEALNDTEVSLKCVDVNEVIYDEKEKYLHKTSSSILDSKEELFREIVTNLEACQDICWNFLRQLVIIKEPRVRFKPHSDVSWLQKKIEETSLSLDVKTYFRDVAKMGYKILKDAGLLKNLVEFEVERHATVDLFGKKLQKVAGNIDMVSLIEIDVSQTVKTDNKIPVDKQELAEAKQGFEKKVAHQRKHLDNKTPDQKVHLETTKQDIKKKSKTIHRKPSKLPELSREDTKYNILDIEEVKEEKKHVESSYTKKHPPKDLKLRKLQRQKEMHESKDSFKSCESNSEEKKFNANLTVCGNITEDNLKAIAQGISDRAIVTFLLTPRLSVNAVQVFRQLLFLHMLPGSLVYLFVCHIGPLNEDQEMVLYKFKPSETLVNACKGDDTNVLDLSKLEETFRAVTGQRLQKLADFKEYFKYYIYDCPGVKNHAKDNTDRLERYLRKKKEKRERKRKEKGNTEESESEFGSEVARAWTPRSDTESWATVSEINESDIMSAADLQNYMEEFK